MKKEERSLKKATEDLTISAIKKTIIEIEKELEPLEEMKLRRLPELKDKALPEKVELSRHNKVPLTLGEIMMQAHYIGCYVDVHPAQLINNGCEQLVSLWTGQRARVCGVINSVKTIKTRKGQQMSFLEIDDSTQIAEVVIFPRLWSRLDQSEVFSGALLNLDVKVQQEEPVIKLIAESIQFYKE